MVVAFAANMTEPYIHENIITTFIAIFRGDLLSLTNASLHLPGFRQNGGFLFGPTRQISNSVTI